MAVGLTPVEILNKQFDKRFRGYDEEQVNDYMDIIVSEFERLIKSNADLQRELADTQDKLRYFEQLQDSLNNSIIVANEAAERLKQNARKEAELILFEAEREADRLVSEANQTGQRIMRENEDLHRMTQQFHGSFKAMLLKQLELLDNGEVSDFMHLADRKMQAQMDFQVPTERYAERIEELAQEAVPASSPAVTLPVQPVVTETPIEQVKPTTIEDLQIGQDSFTVDLSDRYIPADDTVAPEQEIDLREIFSNLQDLAMGGSSDKPAETPPVESVMGQTIRIDLPK